MPMFRAGLQTPLAVPWTLIAAVPVADHWLPPTIHLAPVPAVAVALAAASTSVRWTALTAGLAVAALAIAAIDRSELATETVAVQLLCLVVLGALLVVFCWRRELHERDLARARSVSEAAQRVVLRPLPARAGPVSVASVYRAAEVDAHLGGDFYALARTADSTRVMIGDVRGKGLASLSETAVMLESFRAAAREQLSLPEMVRYMDRSALWGLAEFSRGEAHLDERFVTLAMADIPDDEPVLRLISCGHPSPLLLRRGTATPLTVPDPAPPLGLGVLSGGEYEPQTFGYAPGDMLLLYTDGVTEARDAGGTFYPLPQRAAAWAHRGPAGLISCVEADLRAYVPAVLGDDMAMVAVLREGPPTTRDGGHRRPANGHAALIRPRSEAASR